MTATAVLTTGGLPAIFLVGDGHGHTPHIMSYLLVCSKAKFAHQWGFPLAPPPPRELQRAHAGALSRVGPRGRLWQVRAVVLVTLLPSSRLAVSCSAGACEFRRGTRRRMGGAAWFRQCDDMVENTPHGADMADGQRTWRV